VQVQDGSLCSERPIPAIRGFWATPIPAVHKSPLQIACGYFYDRPVANLAVVFHKTHTMGANLMDEGTTEFNNTHASPEKPHPSEFVEFVSGAPDLLEISKATANTQFETVHNAQTTLACDDVLRDFFSAIPQTLEPSRDAKAATDIERKMTFYNGCRLYPKAMAWSFLLSSTIIMEGYDTTLINSFLPSRPFNGHTDLQSTEETRLGEPRTRSVHHGKLLCRIPPWPVRLLVSSSMASRLIDSDTIGQ
jgi:hypothetical protein